MKPNELPLSESDDDDDDEVLKGLNDAETDDLEGSSPRDPSVISKRTSEQFWGSGAEDVEGLGAEGVRGQNHDRVADRRSTGAGVQRGSRSPEP